MATKVPGDGLADTQADARAMPPALAKALAAKEKSTAKRDVPAADDLSDMRASRRSASGPTAGDGMVADGDDMDERKLPPEVNGKVAEINEYEYSADADAGPVSGSWAKVPDQNSGELPEGSFQRTVRFPDAGIWKQV